MGDILHVATQRLGDELGGRVFKPVRGVLRGSWNTHCVEGDKCRVRHLFQKHFAQFPWQPTRKVPVFGDGGARLTLGKVVERVGGHGGVREPVVVEEDPLDGREGIAVVFDPSQQLPPHFKDLERGGHCLASRGDGLKRAMGSCRTGNDAGRDEGSLGDTRSRGAEDREQEHQDQMKGGGVVQQHSRGFTWPTATKRSTHSP
mmetsp:Transcript_4465/g.10250  ORF Transcript_4465/g.10250 Transcript_4465/m.10250 type:complete len:202 (-) Transcript_4465:89-694(-)